MELSEKDITAYQTWLRKRGIGDGTIRQYVAHARRAANRDVFDVMTDRKLSPKYRRVTRAAAMSFAKFSNDNERLEEITEVKMPAAMRATPKVPLTESAWRALRKEIDDASYIKPQTKAVLGIMSSRGLRCGDVLRLFDREVSDALKKNILSYVAKGERRIEFGVLKSYRPYLEMLKDSFERYTQAEHVFDLVSPKAEEERRIHSAGMAISRALKSAGEAVGAKKLGIPPEELHPHQLRRTYATLYYDACGRDPMRLKQHMNWNSLETAMGYVDHDRRDELDDIAEKMF